MSDKDIPDRQARRTGFGDNRTSLLERGTLVTVQYTDITVSNEEVVRGIEPIVIGVEWLNEGQGQI